MKNRPLCSVCLTVFILLGVMVHWGRGAFVKELRPSPLEQCVTEGEELTLTGQVYQKEIKDDSQVLYLKNNSFKYQGTFLKESRIIVYDNNKINVQIGDEISVTGEVFFYAPASNPGNFDQKLYYQKQDIHAGIWGRKIEISGAKSSCVSYLLERLYQFRNAWKKTLLQKAGKEKGGVLSAILLGEKQEADPEIKQVYQTSGIGHILAISGLHLSFIGVGIYHMIRRLTGSYKAGGLAGICFLVLYILMIGMTVSAARALVMFLFRVGADICGRHYDSSTALSAAAVIVLLWRPLSIYDGGFWLSFGAVAAVILVLPVFAGLPFQSFFSGVGINLVILPILLYFYYEFPPYALLLNLFVIPLMSCLLFFGIFGSIFCTLSFGIVPFTFAGEIMFHICKAILWLYEKGCRISLSLPTSRIVTGQPQIWQIVLYYGCLTIVLVLWNRKKGSCMTPFILAAGLFILCFRFGENDRLLVTVLDVGQGDGIFIKGPDGEKYLIDGGSSDVKNVGQYRIEPFLKCKGVGKLDYVFVSHGDEDHMNGIEELLERQDIGVKIDTLVLPVKEVWDEALEDLAVKAKQEGTKVVIIKPGEKAGGQNMELQCLQPGEEYDAETGNAASMVLSLSFGDFDMLFTGDVEGAGEELLTETLKNSQSSRNWDVLKAAHHGSKSSSAASFLGVVKPRYTMISAGKNNRYGHPHEGTLERLMESGSKIYTTQEGGALEIETEGSTIHVREYLGK